MKTETKTLTPIKAIRAKCMDCSNNQYSEIKECLVTNCSLWPYRLGKRPKKDYQGINNQEHDEN